MMILLAAALAAQTAAPTAPKSTPAPTPALTPLAGADSADARCIVIFGYLGSRGDADQARQSQLATMYFLGKLRARTASMNVARTVEGAAAEARKTGLDAQQEVQRCGGEFEASATSLQGVRPLTDTPPAKP